MWFDAFRFSPPAFDNINLLPLGGKSSDKKYHLSIRQVLYYKILASFGALRAPPRSLRLPRERPIFFKSVQTLFKETRFVGALRAPPRSLRLPRERPIFLKGISLTKAYPVAQIWPNLHKIV